MEAIQGIVEHIVYRNDDNGYTVMEIMSQGTDVVCVGFLMGLQEGEYIKAEGEYVEHSVYGQQFKIATYTVEIPDDIYSIERYLGSGAIKGIGPALAKKIVNAFTDQTFRVIEEEPERLAEIRGISEKKAMEIYRQFYEMQGMRNAVMFLSKYGISMTYATKIFNQYGSKVYDILNENPYRLAEDIQGIGFKLADEIAAKLGISSNSDYRIRSGIIYILMQGLMSGHTYLPLSSLYYKAQELLGVNEEMVDKNIMDLAIDKKIVVKESDQKQVIYLYSYYYLELNSAKILSDLNAREHISVEQVEKVLSVIEREEEISLDERQHQAVIEAARNGVLIITGGPGTGKTTTINAIIKYFEYEGRDILLGAPTGRAAKRMTEATGYEAQTIHRLLELSGAPKEHGMGNFERNELNPLEADVIIIDEMSMVDISLLHSLLKAVLEGTHLILVGDVDQLPSVGAGNVLKDLIASESFEVVKLTKIFRQALESAIVTSAHKINQGRTLDLDVKTRDFFCLKRYDPNDITGVIVALIRDKLPPNVDARPFDIQVLTPMRKGELGVERLNTVLQEYLNPPMETKREKEFRQGVFREGDKVMQIKNNYQLEWEITSGYNIVIDKGVGVFNGDTGIIKEINYFANHLTVEFEEGRRVVYPFTLLEELELAYAMTIHKSQGSEYPAVIIPLLSGPRMLFNRNILYTAVTRAKKCVALVGSEHTVNKMIENQQENKRYSSLDERLKEFKIE